MTYAGREKILAFFQTVSHILKTLAYESGPDHAALFVLEQQTLEALDVEVGLLCHDVGHVHVLPSPVRHEPS